MPAREIIRVAATCLLLFGVAMGVRGIWDSTPGGRALARFFVRRGQPDSARAVLDSEAWWARVER